METCAYGDNPPADCASRGLLPKEMIAYTLWWKGPPWLLMEPPQLPPQPLSSPVSTSELKAVCHVAGPTSPDWIEDKYSSYTQLLRITAWIFRFIANLKAHKTKASMTHTQESHRLLTGEPLRPSSPLTPQ